MNDDVFIVFILMQVPDFLIHPFMQLKDSAADNRPE